MRTSACLLLFYLLFMIRVRSFNIAKRLCSTTNQHSLRAALSDATTMESAVYSITARGTFIDAHAHLFHEQFDGEGVREAIVEKCVTAGLDRIVVNGLEPITNRQTLELCDKYPHLLLPALGIYPLDACCHALAKDPSKWAFDFPPPAVFDIDQEIAFIDEMCAAKKIVAIGECGLDRHYVADAESVAEQEAVLRKLCRLGIKHDLPVILHSRKAEERTLQLLLEEGVKKADFHCFCGKAKLGVKIAEAGYYLSIPSAVERTDSFKKLVSLLPMDRILTETDCPYMGPDKGERNDPSTVPRGVAAIAAVKRMTPEEANEKIRSNFRTLFNL